MLITWQFQSLIHIYIYCANMNVMCRNGSLRACEVWQVTERIASFAYGYPMWIPWWCPQKPCNLWNMASKHASWTASHVRSVQTHLGEPSICTPCWTHCQGQSAQTGTANILTVMMNLRCQLTSVFWNSNIRRKRLDEYVFNATSIAHIVPTCASHAVTYSRRTVSLRKHQKWCLPEWRSASILLTWTRLKRKHSLASWMVTTFMRHPHYLMPVQRPNNCPVVSLVHTCRLVGIFNTLTKCTDFQMFGGIDWTSRWCAQCSRINSTNGVCSGIIPALRIFNTKRLDWPVSAAMVLGPSIWSHGTRTLWTFCSPSEYWSWKCSRTDLFYGLWIPDLFTAESMTTKISPFSALLKNL